MGWLDKLTGKSAPEPVAVAAAPVRDGVHHEFFIDDAPVNGRWLWLCRVYDQIGQPHEMTGSEETNAQAAQAAIRWADATKASLRRTA